MESTPGASAKPTDGGALERPCHPLAPAAELVLALHETSDLDTLERRLLAFAVHPDGLGARGAWLLAWDAEREGFELARSARPTLSPTALREALHLPIADAPAGTDPEALVPEESLGGALEAAWSHGLPGSARCEGSAAWCGGEAAAMPMRSGLRPYGLFVAAWDDVLPESGRAAAIAALHRLAVTAADALERGQDARRRARQCEAVRELAKLAVSPANLAEAVRLVVRVAAHASSARGSALWLEGEGGALRLEATHGPAGQREGIARALQSAAADVAASGRSRAVDRVEEADGLEDGAAWGLRSVLFTPINAYGRVCGAIAVYDRALAHRASPSGFDAADREFLGTLADLVAAMVDGAARFDAVRSADRRGRELQSQNSRLERAALAGERAAQWMREARNPLLSIAAFARRAQRTLAEGDPLHEYLSIVLRETERLERLCAGTLAPPAADDSALKVESVNAAIQEALQQSSETLVRRRVRLLKRLAPDLPPLLVDASRLRRTLRNIVDHALDSVAIGGRIRIESRRTPQHVVVDVAHDGPRRPGEMLEKLFAPFAEGRTAPAEPGLALARQMVREHGGEIRLRSEGEWTSIVSFTLPIAENRDRRIETRERRSGRTDRRSGSACS